MSAVTNLLPTIVAKSDQLNADDLIGGPKTVTVTKVSLMGEADQPVAIHYEGDEGKPFKPCKSMRRLMVHIWGSDGNAYAGQRMTLYRDDRVTFGKDAVGGIRISHMSGIDRDTSIALMVTRGQRKPYTVKPLPHEQRKASAPRGSEIAAPDYIFDDAAEFAGAAKGLLSKVKTTARLGAVWKEWGDELRRLRKADPVAFQEITAAKDDRKRDIEAQGEADEHEPDAEPVGREDQHQEAGDHAPAIEEGAAEAASPNLLAGMKRGSDLLAEQEAEAFDPMEWKAVAEGYIATAKDQATLDGLFDQWEREGLLGKLKAASKTDWRDLCDSGNERGAEIARQPQ